MIIDISEDGYMVTWKSLVTGIQRTATIVQLVEAFDADPTKYGRWETPKGYPNVLLCSECNTPYEKKEFVATPNYCPNCGARMDESEAEE